ncbi:hypothetical protein GW814_01880, partial [Candidatus Falkowbacteria bacterium]|nr:hypothetical protein [Candidatus Falkowbacteria bacterium]
TFTKIIEGLKK